MGRKSVRPRGREVVIYKIHDKKYRWYVRHCTNPKARGFAPMKSRIFRTVTYFWSVTHYSMAGRGESGKKIKIPEKYFPEKGYPAPYVPKKGS